jgi:glycosyltransferase involved in cell wall biosynthesis
MSNQLLFITKVFPFGTGEEFLENEIRYLAADFDEVVILAAAVGASAPQTRDIPTNAVAIAADIPPVSKLDAVISPGHVARGRGAFEHGASEHVASERAVSFKELMGDYDRHMQRFHPARWLYFRYFTRKTHAISEAILALFEDGVLNAGKLSLMYSFWFHDTALAALLVRDTLKLDIPVVARAAGYDLYESSSPVGYHPLRPWALEHIDRVFPVSKEGKAYLDQRFPGFSSKIEAAFMGTNDRGIGPCASWQGKRPSFMIVSCSNFVEIKRLDLLVEALALLEGMSPCPLRWVHFGSGEQEDRIRRLAHEKLEKTDWTLAGQVSNNQLMEFYRENPVDVFVSVSKSEGGPVTAMEALSFGIPVVATRVGSVGESMADGAGGMSLPLDVEPQAVAESLFALAQRTPDDYRALREEARLLWEQRFDTQRNYTAFVAELRDAAAQRRSPC